MRKFTVKTLTLILTVCLAYADAMGLVRPASSSEEREVMQEVSFNLTRNAQDPKRYHLVISDTEERVISGTFSIDQLQILRALMTEAEKFAWSAEAAGTTEPLTTRFADKNERSFLVDVEKIGNQSTLFLTLSTENGTQTMNSGRIMRSNRREEGFFFDLLSRLESILPKLPT